MILDLNQPFARRLRLKILSCAIPYLLGVPSTSYAQNEIGFNAGEFLEKAALSKVLGGSSSGWFLPFHFTYSRELNEKYVLTHDLVYRFDNHGTFDGYKEFLALVGIGTWLSQNTLGTFKLGGGKASGPLASDFTLGKNGDFVSGLYSCSQLAFQASLENRSDLGNGFEMGLGGALLVIVPTSCENEIAFSGIGNLVHRYVPIFSWNLIYNF